MFRNYLLVTLRSLRKNSIYSFINITGLSIGITCSILILLWVNDELSYNKFLPKSEKLYQLWLNAKFDGEIHSGKSMPQPSYAALKERDANIKNTAITDCGGEHLLIAGEQRLMKDAFYVTEEFLEMFQYPLLHGDASQVLDEPASIVITEVDC